MPAKASAKSGTKRKSKATKEALPSPDELKDGAHDYYIGNWSHHQSVEDISSISDALLAAHTQDDRQVTKLPRVNVLLLPPTAGQVAQREAEATTSHGTGALTEEPARPLCITVVDNMHIEGVSRRTLVESESRMKDWKRNPPAVEPQAAGEGGDGGDDGQTTDPLPTEENPAAAEESAEVPPYMPTELDVLETMPVTCGADFSARHARVSGPVSVEGVLPQVVVKPSLPDPPAVNDDLFDGTSRKVSTAKSKGAKKGKKAPKLTPEELEALEQKKAEAEAEFQRLTEEAVQKAKEQEDYLMTFAHPDRWAKVVITNLTFTAPVVVRRAHVTFQNCTFTSATHAAAQLTVSQYCRVSCTKCTFDAPHATAVYALPTSQIDVSKCLFTGLPQVQLALALRDADADAHASGKRGSPVMEHGEDEDDEAASGGEDGVANGTEITRDRALLPAIVVKIASVAQRDRASVVGVYGDAARVRVSRCEFVFLGTAVVLRGRFPLAARLPEMKGLPKSSAPLMVEDNLLHYLYNTGILVESSARDALIQGNHTADCAYYALDCQGGAKGIAVLRNNFSANSVVRIRKGCQPRFLENQLDAVLIDDNAHDNPAMDPVY